MSRRDRQYMKGAIERASTLTAVLPAKIIQMPQKDGPENDNNEAESLNNEEFQEPQQVHLINGLGYSPRPHSRDGQTPMFYGYRSVGGTGEEPW